MQGDKTPGDRESESGVEQLGHGAGRELLKKYSHPKHIRSLGKQKVSLQGVRLCLDLIVTIWPPFLVPGGLDPSSQFQQNLHTQLGEIQ